MEHVEATKTYVKCMKNVKQRIAVTKSAVLRQALQLYEYLVESWKRGESFRTVDSHGREKELVLFRYK